MGATPAADQISLADFTMTESASTRGHYAPYYGPPRAKNHLYLGRFPTEIDHALAGGQHLNEKIVDHHQFMKRIVTGRAGIMAILTSPTMGAGSYGETLDWRPS